MLTELYKTPKPQRSFSLFSFFPRATKSISAVPPSSSFSCSTSCNSHENKLQGDISSVKQEPTVNNTSMSLSSSVPAISTKTEDEDKKCQDNISLVKSEIVKEETFDEDEKFGSEGEEDCDDFDDFDIDKVDLMFLSQQRWIERCIEAEKVKQQQEPSDSKHDLVTPSTAMTVTTKNTGKRKREDCTTSKPTPPQKKRKVRHSAPSPTQVNLASFFGARRKTIE